MPFVTDCPKNLSEVEKASKALRCGRDKYNNSQYICLPNAENKSLMEICFDGVMGLHEKGNCLEFSDGSFILRNCQSFKFGCPENHTRSNEFYKYPACHTIDTKQQCYVLDPSCQGHDTSTEAKVDLNIMCMIGWVLLAVCVLVCILCKVKKRLPCKVSDQSQNSIELSNVKKTQDDIICSERNDVLNQSSEIYDGNIKINTRYLTYPGAVCQRRGITSDTLRDLIKFTPIRKSCNLMRRLSSLLKEKQRSDNNKVSPISTISKETINYM
uniref:Uncharacterized protein LOC111113274 isoform X2 n=1 Tax=Crassostrea virginica TaxID=6565 RepID=A0A8B8BUS0_CRAVI|nr:uncharacterized protein LOC111113274 isoform X2 [Crassostrea virginica]